MLTSHISKHQSRQPGPLLAALNLKLVQKRRFLDGTENQGTMLLSPPPHGVWVMASRSVRLVAIAHSKSNNLRPSDESLHQLSKTLLEPLETSRRSCRMLDRAELLLLDHPSNCSRDRMLETALVG